MGDVEAQLIGEIADCDEESVDPIAKRSEQPLESPFSNAFGMDLLEPSSFPFPFADLEKFINSNSGCFFSILKESITKRC